ncbi:ribonuclease H [Clostridium sp. N3C]|uniref:RNase H family protein n=1 Tax=Clostridium sp. N3C TaxID=1776758 RepID=UPI00092E169D|nr:RNase H family protein [Clostridium sp. N3C]SCN24195.1 ribonuclease H [Clostridium sp. N3C]
MNTTPISIYTDGSYRDCKGGYSFVFDNAQEFNLPKIVFGVSSDSTSTSVELTAIIRAFQYLKAIGFKNHPIKIRCDVVDICRRLNKNTFNKWDASNWQKSSGNPITPNIQHWFMLSKLIKEYGYDNIKIQKAPKGDHHRIAHRYSRVGNKLDISEENILYILDSNKDPNKLKINQCKKMYISSFIEDLPAEKPWELPLPIPAPPPKKVAKKDESRIKWFDRNKLNTTMVELNKIILTEDIHLKAKEISFNGILKKLNSSDEITIPIAIRPIENGYYSLVAGFTLFSAAKILGKFEYIPCVITDLTHEDFFKYIESKNEENAKP